MAGSSQRDMTPRPCPEVQHAAAQALGPLCPLCQGATAREILRSSNGYTILSCLNCSLVFTDDRAAPPSDNLYPVFDQSDSGISKAIGRALALFLRQRELFVRQVKPSGRLLDFGCGNGAFARHMSRTGFDAVGIEPFSLGATISGERLKLVQAPLEHVERDLGLFDVITLWHVLEHMRRPAEMLRHLRTLLAPDGVIVISVPNFASLQSTMFEGRWFHLDPPRHLVHFVSATLEDCLRRAGLVSAAHKYFLPEYGCSGWVQSSLNLLPLRTNYLYELVKDRGAIRDMSRMSSALHFITSMLVAPPALALSLPVETVASMLGRGAVLTVAARRL
jgi:SAM-dependent methyltransferase